MEIFFYNLFTCVTSSNVNFQPSFFKWYIVYYKKKKTNFNSFYQISNKNKNNLMIDF